MDVAEEWRLDREGTRHTVIITMPGGLGRRITWTLDAVQVAEEATHDERVVLDGGEHGAVAVRLPRLPGPARRVTWWPADDDLGAVVAAHTGIGGVDLDPAPGTTAAEREAWIRAHPRLYLMRQVGARSAAVIGAAVLAWLLSQVVLPAIPWPEIRLPRIPWPRIPWPEIPWPEIRLPRIPWPSIPWPEWDLPPPPDWVIWVMDHLRFIGPVVVAAVMAANEVRRRRKQDAAKANGSRLGQPKQNAAKRATPKQDTAKQDTAKPDTAKPDTAKPDTAKQDAIQVRD